jgi:cytochrome P450
MTDTATDFDELRFDEASFYLDDPHPVLARLRAEDPVHWYERGDFWVVTRYDDIKAIEANPSVFASRRHHAGPARPARGVPGGPG